MIRPIDAGCTVTRVESSPAVQRVEHSPPLGRSQIAWPRARPEIVRAAFEGRRLRCAIVAHSHLLSRFVGTCDAASTTAAGHQRAHAELERSVSRSRAELREVVRSFARRLAADGLSRENTTKMLTGLVESALVEAPSQPSAALAVDVVAWGVDAFRAARRT